MVSSLIGKFVSFPCSYTHTPGRCPAFNSFANIHGEIVGIYVGDERCYQFCIGNPDSKARAVLIVRLLTFSKDALIELPIESVRFHEDEESAKLNCTVE